MMCGWAGRHTVALVRRSLLTLPTSINKSAAFASKTEPQRTAETRPPPSSPCSPRNPRQCCDTAFDFIGKIILVTGAAKGIGRATASALVACGAKVIAVDNCEEELACLCAESWGRVVPVRVDLSDWECTKGTLAPYLECPVDGVVNNAAILIKEPFLEMTRCALESQLNLNVVAYLHVAMLCAQNMVKHDRKGSIVNVASVCSELAAPQMAAYCTTKGGIAQGTRSMAAELGCHGIRVNSVSPSLTCTEMGRLTIDKPEEEKKWLKRTPLNRIAEVCEVTDVILYLLGDRATFISGANFPVDGGYWAT